MAVLEVWKKGRKNSPLVLEVDGLILYNSLYFSFRIKMTCHHKYDFTFFLLDRVPPENVMISSSFIGGMTEFSISWMVSVSAHIFSFCCQRILNIGTTL